jgi:hypothetical protein
MPEDAGANKAPLALPGSGSVEAKASKVLLIRLGELGAARLMVARITQRLSEKQLIKLSFGGLARPTPRSRRLLCLGPGIESLPSFLVTENCPPAPPNLDDLLTHGGQISRGDRPGFGADRNSQCKARRTPGATRKASGLVGKSLGVVCPGTSQGLNSPTLADCSSPTSSTR